MHCRCTLSGKQAVALPDNLRPRLFAGVSQAELDSIMALARHKEFRKSSVVLHEGEPAESFFLLASGHGRQFVTTSSGRKVLLHWLTPGQIFGGTAALIDPCQYLASTEVLAGSCAWTWDRPVIREVVTRIPRLLDNGLSIAVTEHIEWSVAARVALSSRDARGRVAHLLASLAAGIGHVTPDGIELKVANEEISSGANVTLFTASHILSELQRNGIVRKGRGRVVLLKPFLMSE